MDEPMQVAEIVKILAYCMLNIHEKHSMQQQHWWASRRNDVACWCQLALVPGYSNDTTGTWKELSWWERRRLWRGPTAWPPTQLRLVQLFLLPEAETNTELLMQQLYSAKIHQLFGGELTTLSWTTQNLLNWSVHRFCVWLAFPALRDFTSTVIHSLWSYPLARDSV